MAASPTKIFLNLPVKDLERSKAFFGKLGYAFNPKFTDANGTCMVISDTIYVMLLTEKRFKDFTPKDVADATKTTEALIALSMDSRAQVDAFMDKAIAAGATEVREPDDHGFMYGRSFNDPDGHIWEMYWMDPKVAE